MNNNLSEENKILDQNNIKCEYCEADFGTRCESNPSHCPYRANKDNQTILKDNKPFI
jgi:hypothetical protein